MKFAIIASRKDRAGMNITSFLELPVNFVEQDIVYAENIDKQLDKDTDFIIFISKHQGKHPRMLSIHAPGNFSSADFGGIAGKVCPTSAFILKIFFINLNKLIPPNWQATLEVTHHGPYINKPCLFIEIGSNEQDWKSVEAAKAIAKTIKQSIEQINKTIKQNYVAVILLGGGHYNQAGNKIMLNSNYAIGHIIPKYMLEFIDENIVNEAITKTIPKPEIVLLDWKGLGKYKKKVVSLLNKMNLKFERVHNIPH